DERETLPDLEVRGPLEGSLLGRFGASLIVGLGDGLGGCQVLTSVRRDRFSGAAASYSARRGGTQRVDLARIRGRVGRGPRGRDRRARRFPGGRVRPVACDEPGGPGGLRLRDPGSP